MFCIDKSVIEPVHDKRGWGCMKEHLQGISAKAMISKTTQYISQNY